MRLAAVSILLFSLVSSALAIAIIPVGGICCGQESIFEITGIGSRDIVTSRIVNAATGEIITSMVQSSARRVIAMIPPDVRRINLEVIPENGQPVTQTFNVSCDKE